MQRNPLTWLCAIAAVGIATSVLAQPIVPVPAFSGKQLTAFASPHRRTGEQYQIKHEPIDAGHQQRPQRHAGDSTGFY